MSFFVLFIYSTFNFLIIFYLDYGSNYDVSKMMIKCLFYGSFIGGGMV